MKDKTGSTSTLKKFRYFIREIEKNNHLPDYFISLSNDEIVTFTNQEYHKKIAVGINDLPAISRETIEKGAKITEEAGTGWDYYELRQQFTQQLLKGFRPDNVNGAFINFVKKKVTDYSKLDLQVRGPN